MTHKVILLKISFSNKNIGAIRVIRGQFVLDSRDILQMPERSAFDC